MIDYHWKADFTFFGLELKGLFNRDGLRLENDPGRKYFVQGSYKFTTATKEENALWKAREFVDDLLNVLITGANLGFYSSFPKLVDLNVVCENSEEIGRSGQGIPNYPRVGAYEEIQPVSIDAPTLSGYIDAAGKIRSKAGQDYDRIATLLRAGVTASDEYAKFIGICRAFNALYECLIPGTSARDVDKIKMFPQKAFDRTTAKSVVDLYSKPTISGWGEMQLRLLMLGHMNILEMLSKAGLKSEKGTIDYSAELATARGSSDPFIILSSSLLCLYSVRNGVVHGSRYSYQEVDFLYLCSLLLQEVIMNALNIHFIRKYAI